MASDQGALTAPATIGVGLDFLRRTWVGWRTPGLKATTLTLGEQWFPLSTRAWGGRRELEVHVMGTTGPSSLACSVTQSG